MCSRCVRKFLGMVLSLGLAVSAFAGCGSSTGTSSSSSSSTSKALGTCETSSSYHEYQLTADATLKASFDQIAVTHLETNTTAPDDTRDSGTVGVDIIPYSVTDGPREITFTLSSSGTVSTAVLTDADASVVFTMNKGDAATAVTLANGNYSLTLTSDNVATNPIFMMPSSCVTGEASANVSMSVTKATNFQTPGVYITELPVIPATTIPTSANGVTYFVGSASQGIANVPTEIASWSQYDGEFGSEFMTPFDLAVYEFFIAGGDTLTVVNAQTTSSADLLAALNSITATSYNFLVMPDLANMSQSEAIGILNSAIPAAANSSAIMVVDYPSSITTQAGIMNFAQLLKNNVPADISNAALFFPSVMVLNPIFSQLETIGNGSSVVGLFMANDSRAGVWQPTAGVTFGELFNVVNLPVDPSDAEAATLADAGINAIQEKLGFGTVIWGNTLLFLNQAATDGSSKLNVRRTMLAVEQAIKVGVQWVVFEPNDANSWSLVTSDVSNYLNTLWEQGALFGASASEAYYVSCGLGSSMTADDILNGLMIIDIGIAVNRPGQFMTIQVVQQMQGD